MNGFHMMGSVFAVFFSQSNFSGSFSSFSFTSELCCSACDHEVVSHKLDHYETWSKWIDVPRGF